MDDTEVHIPTPKSKGDAMPEITWENPFCGEGGTCFRLGTDSDGSAYIAVAGQESTPLTDTRDALRALIQDIKGGAADHLVLEAGT